MTDKPRRASVGFHGGQTLALRVTQAQLETLKRALTERDGGWTDLETADGAVTLAADQVVYLRVESDDHRVGF